MASDIFVLAEHHEGEVKDGAFDLLAKARELAGASGGEVVAVLLGHGAGGLAGDLPADRVLYVDHPALDKFLAEPYLAVLEPLVRERDPRVVMIENTTVGMELAAPLAARAGRPVVAYCIDLAVEGDGVVATSQLFGGKLNAEVETGACVAAVVGGAFSGERTGGSPQVEEIAGGSELDDLKIRFLARVEPETSDIDITGESILVSVGRGIGGEENIELAQELADALGGVVTASRPVTDAKWLPKTRQVGKSGRKVKPKLYVACGISGAPEHLEGMRDAELIIAINTDANAPIFDVAHYGTTEDLFDILPELTEKIEAGVAAG